MQIRKHDRSVSPPVFFFLVLMLGGGVFLMRAFFAAFPGFFDSFLFFAFLRCLAFVLTLLGQLAALLPGLTARVLLLLVEFVLLPVLILVRLRAAAAFLKSTLMAFLEIAVKRLPACRGVAVNHCVALVKSG
jgi:hypothetical protein